MKVSLLIPTYNAGTLWQTVLESIAGQDFLFYRKIIADSGSKDDTVPLSKKYGFEVLTIPQAEFSHGGTRQQLADESQSDIVVFLTQDAILASSKSVSNLVAAFIDTEVALAYGRQLPHKNAKLLESHARLFNYPSQSSLRTYQDKERMGFKVFFCSNSFSAYRVTALNEAGKFPSKSIMGEDALVSARILMNQHRIAYVAEATVYHSHSYSLKEEFKRYFDTRIFHEQNQWLISAYGKPTGEGIKYVKSEFCYVGKRNPLYLFKMAGSVLAKWSGYFLGRFYKKMPISLLKRLSMHKAYWR